MSGKRFSESELAVVRRAFARQMMALANVWDERVGQAFATIPRWSLSYDEVGGAIDLTNRHP